MAKLRKIVVSQARRVLTVRASRAPVWKVQGQSRASVVLRLKMQERAQAKAMRDKARVTRVSVSKFMPSRIPSLDLYTNAGITPRSMPLLKLYKLVDDPCFGQKHELIDQCKTCWIKKSCATKFRNRHHA